MLPKPSHTRTCLILRPQGQNFNDMEVAKLDKVIEIARKSEVDTSGA